MPLEALNFKSSHWKCKEVQKGQIKNEHILGWDSAWEFVIRQVINSHSIFFLIWKLILSIPDFGESLVSGF